VHFTKYYYGDKLTDGKMDWTVRSWKCLKGKDHSADLT